MNVRDSLIWAKKNLSGSVEPDSSALIFLEEILKTSRADVLANLQKEISGNQETVFKKFVKRRREHEPVWQIIGRVNFYGLNFFITPDVLVPRPETEIIVKKAVEWLEKNGCNGENYHPSEQKNNFKILDVGTGSGAIAVAIAYQLSLKKIKYEIEATDISQKAIEVAKKNAEHNDVIDKIRFFQADFFHPTNYQDKKVKKYDVITANLPYIPSEEMKLLGKEVYHYDPHSALDGGRGGLEVYENFFHRVDHCLKENTVIFCEIGINQSGSLKKIVEKNLPGMNIKFCSDLAGIKRVAIIKNAR